MRQDIAFDRGGKKNKHCYPQNEAGADPQQERCAADFPGIGCSSRQKINSARGRGTARQEE
jgi:hypothetical protein